jgi:hypothetical protein
MQFTVTVSVDQESGIGGKLGIPDRGGSWHFHIATGVFAIATVLYCDPSRCVAKAHDITQQDLRMFAEQAIASQLVEVKPPEFEITHNPEDRRLSVYFGDYTPRPHTVDPFVNWALNEQFQVALIRRYRNTPERRRNWAQTLTSIEQQIESMLKAANDSALNDEQKNAVLRQCELNVSHTYKQHFNAVVYSQQLNGWDKKHETYRVAEYYTTKFMTQPRGVVRYMPAGRWELHQFALQQNVRLPAPKWDVPAENKALLVGKYYFSAIFENHTPVAGPVAGPVTIHQSVTLLFTPQGMQQQ